MHKCLFLQKLVKFSAKKRVFYVRKLGDFSKETDCTYDTFNIVIYGQKGINFAISIETRCTHFFKSKQHH